MSKWSHLANAKHIDRIIAHVNAHPTAWEEAAYNAAWEKSCDAARDATWSALWDAAWDEVTFAAVKEGLKAADDAVKDKSCDAARDAAYEAILALVVLDHASGLMDLPAEQVKVLALLGDQAASLMYPAIVAMETRCRLTI